MGWETRERGGRYYVQKRRVGGKVVSEYRGSGPLAELVAALDNAERAEKREARQQARQAWEAVCEEDTAIALFCADVEATFRQEMQAAGYHRPKRGEWRKRRGNSAQSQ